jgi:hypothetical protein
MQITDSFIGSDYFAYSLLGNIFGLNGIINSYYAIKVISIQLNLFTPFTSVSSTSNTIYTDTLSNQYMLYKGANSLNFTLDGVSSNDMISYST